MDKKLLNIFSMRLEFLEKTLAFLDMREEFAQLHQDIGQALCRHDALLRLEGILDAYETKLFDNPKMLSLSSDERIHPLLKELVK